MHGSVSSSERDRILHTAWMSINASEGEGWGLSVVEANAAGVPVLAYRRPGLRDSISDGQTGLADRGRRGARLPPSPRRCGRSGDEEAAAAIATRARQWASQFTWDKMADQVLALLASRSGAPGPIAQQPADSHRSVHRRTDPRRPYSRRPGPHLPRHRPVQRQTTTDLVVLLRNTDTDTAMSRPSPGRIHHRAHRRRATYIYLWPRSHRSGVAGLPGLGAVRRVGLTSPSPLPG